MEKKIKDIRIVFSENQQDSITKIEDIIQKNYELILSFFIGDKTIDISRNQSNFDTTFYYIVNSMFNNADIKELLDDEDFLSILHVESLIRRNHILGTTIVENHSDTLSDEFLSSFIAYKYFELNVTFNDFVEYLKVRNMEDELFRWLQNVSRWDTYNYLLEITSNFLKTDDETFFKQMSYITYIWFNYTIEYIRHYENTDLEYPEISKKQFDTLVCELLNYIKALNDWLRTYQNLKTNGLIMFVEEDQNDSSKCFLDSDGITKILIDNSNNLKGFCIFIHEFIHYISRKNSLPEEKISNSEFPSIFFEKISGEFLVKKGYSSNIVKQILSFREKNNYSLSFSLVPLFNDLARYINYGKIKRSDKISLYKNQIESLNRIRKNMLKIITDAGYEIKDYSVFQEVSVDIDNEADRDCDSLIDLFMKSGLLVINGYQYLLDSYLVNQVLNNRNGDTKIFEKMIDVTNNLGMIDVKDILKLFDIENVFQEEYVRELIKK